MRPQWFAQVAHEQEVPGSIPAVFMFLWEPAILFCSELSQLTQKNTSFCDEKPGAFAGFENQKCGGKTSTIALTDAVHDIKMQFLIPRGLKLSQKPDNNLHKK